MTKIVNKRFLLSMALFSLLLVFCVHSSLATPTFFPEPTAQDKALKILTDVADIDLTRYSVIPREYSPDAYFDVVPQENVHFNLESDTSKLNVFCTFTDKKLQILHVLEREGTPHLTKSATNVRKMAKDFLNNYQNYSRNSFYGKLGSMLDNFDANKNLTKTSGNIKFEVTNSGDYKTFTWSYTFNGIECASKCISLGYKNGFLKYYIDTWDLYKIGGTNVNLSEKEAIEIAMENAKTFSWKVVLGNDTFEINNFKVTEAMVTKLVFCSSFNADNVRNEDLLTIYPMWRIGIGLDKYYPGNVYGICVDIWADTKEVRHIQEVFSTLPPTANEIATIDASSVGTLNSQASDVNAQPNSIPITWIVLPALIAVMLGTAPVWLSKKKHSSVYRLPKLRSYLIGGVLLCLLICFTMLFVPILAVNAASNKGRSTIWGSLAEPKTNDEKIKQDEVCNYINSRFSFNNYVSSDYQGSYTLKSNVLNSIESDEENYQCVATVWFDHGVGRNDTPAWKGEWHFMLCDSSSNPSGHIFDYEIYDRTWRGKTFFAFISTCMSAALEIPYNETTGEPYGTGTYGANTGGSGEIIGMPYAWTHGVEWEEGQPGYDGYGNPDDGGFCYIGFPYGSAALDQVVDWDYSTVTYYDWVRSFFNYSLNYDMSVNQGLDHASMEHFNSYFGSTALYTGFTAHWPYLPDPPGNSCTMVVYGNGGMYLHYPVEVRAYDDYSNPVSTPVYIDSTAVGWTPGTFGVPPGTHNIGVLNYPDDYHSFTHFGGYPAGQNPITVSVTSSKLLWAYYNYGILQYSLTISAGTGGTTSPSPGTYYYSPGTYVQVTADAYGGYDFDYWLLDGGYYSSNPTVTVTMDSNHNLQAIFKQEQTGHQVTVYAYNQYGYQGYVPLYIDGQYKGTTPYTCVLSEGNHQIYVESPLYDGYYHVFQCYYYGSYNYNNPMTVYVGSSMGIVAYYYSYYW